LLSWLAGSLAYAAVLWFTGEPNLRRLVDRKPTVLPEQITPVALAEQRAA
jgi:hypothetical protein